MFTLANIGTGIFLKKNVYENTSLYEYLNELKINLFISKLEHYDSCFHFDTPPPKKSKKTTTPRDSLQDYAKSDVLF